MSGAGVRSGPVAAGPSDGHGNWAFQSRLKMLAQAGSAGSGRAPPRPGGPVRVTTPEWSRFLVTWRPSRVALCGCRKAARRQVEGWASSMVTPR